MQKDTYNEKLENDTDTEYGCKFCWDKRAQKEKEILFFDPANNLRSSKFCPWCGRKYLV